MVVPTRARIHLGRTPVTVMMDMYSLKTKDNAQVKYPIRTYQFELFSIELLLGKWGQFRSLIKKMVHFNSTVSVNSTKKFLFLSKYTNYQCYWLHQF